MSQIVRMAEDTSDTIQELLTILVYFDEAISLREELRSRDISQLRTTSRDITDLVERLKLLNGRLITRLSASGYSPFKY